MQGVSVVSGPLGAFHNKALEHCRSVIKLDLKKIKTACSNLGKNFVKQGRSCVFQKNVKSLVLAVKLWLITFKAIHEFSLNKNIKLFTTHKTS